jgi:KamA family protein
MDQIPQLQKLPEADRVAMQAVAAVLPFRVNEYVVDELINWDNIPDDPMFQLTFPQPGMLAGDDFSRMAELFATGASKEKIKEAARSIQFRLNPHPAGQKELNVPHLGEEAVPGVQHKYRETVLFFPSAGQTCHAYCTYCFRWAQFVGLEDLKFAGKESGVLVKYLQAHPEVNSVLFTGGDPMVMKTKVLRRYIEPLLDPKLSHIESIRIGTKALAYWPFRFTSDEDSDYLMRLFEEVRAAGKHLALMAHYSHPREIETEPAQEAIRRVLSAGAVIRCQAPLIRHVNDTSEVWSRMWRLQTRLGMVPYYMFVERDTGARHYFEVPLARAYKIFNEAYSQVSGLSRTVRGPSMSATPGKVLIDGITQLQGEKVFLLKFLQGRNPDWVGKPFFAKFDDEATWLDDLEPAFGEDEFFFEDGMKRLTAASSQGSRLHILRQKDRSASVS